MTTDSLGEDLVRLVRVAMGGAPPDAGIADQVLDAAARKLGVPLPGPLRLFYRTVGGITAVMDAYQHFMQPHTLARQNGALRFCDENQVVVFWSVLEANLRLEDPPVHQGNPEEKVWYEDCRSLRSFLVNMTCWQLICSMPSAAVCGTSPKELRALRARLHPLTRPEDYEVQSFIDEPHGLLACLVSSAGEMHLAGKTDDDLERLARDTGVGLSYR